MTTAQSACGRRQCWSVVALVAAMVVAFLVVAAIGAAQAARDERIFSFLDPAIDFLRGAGLRSLTWLAANSRTIGWTVSAAASAIALVGLLAGRARALPLVLIAAAVSLATWGQVFVLADRTTLGAWLYGSAMACSVVLGIWCPMTRLSEFPLLPFPTRKRRPPVTDPAEAVDAGVPVTRLPWGWECLAVFLLLVVGLLMRTYALTELPHSFDLELMAFQVASRTPFGYHEYIRTGTILTNGAGAFTQLTQMLLFRVFGTSVFTLRMTAVLWGTVAIPLFYWLVRRIAGVSAALLSTVLFMVGPEQLFWSRTENTHFAAIAVLALITGNLGLSMVQRFSIRSVLAAALWMPFCRYFYTPGMIMFVYPLALYGHAVIFVRNAWRKAWYVVPVLAGGLALWIFSLSVVMAYANNGQWRFVDPTMVYGAPAWRKQGEFRDVSIPELVRLQAVSVSRNLGLLLEGMVYKDRFQTHWYERYDSSTSLNLGFAVALALGVGYLAGQVYERRAAVLLLWIALGLLPACLSNEATVRRMSLMFPAAHAVAGIMVITILRIMRQRAGRWVGGLAVVGLGGAVGGIVWTSLASHFLLPIKPVFVTDLIRFAEPLFAESDVIYTDYEPGMRTAMLFGNLDRFLESRPCFQYVRPTQWLDIALHPRCDFQEQNYSITMPPEQVDVLRRNFHPRRISYLLEETPWNLPHINLLRALFPGATIRAGKDPRDGRGLLGITVDISQVEALRAPTVVAGSAGPATAALDDGLLAGITLTSAPAAVGAPPGEGLSVRGGVVLEHDGWYQFGLEPPCPGAAFTVDDHPAAAPAARPFFAGVHSFELTLANAAACSLPVRLVMQDGSATDRVPVSRDMLVSAGVAALPQAHAPPVVTYPGYGDAKVVTRLQGQAWDMGVDGEGYVSVLVLNTGSWRVLRFSPDGHEETAWQPDIPPSSVVSHAPMVVSADGTCMLAAGTTMMLYDRTGNKIDAWEIPFGEFPAEIALWHDDHIAMAIPARGSIAVFTRAGTLETEFKRFDGGPEKFFAPTGLAVSASGDFMVIQRDGEALLFENSAREWRPTFVRSFRIDFSRLDFSPRGAAFDGQDRILVPDVGPATLVYNLEAQRMLAATPGRDLSAHGLGTVVGFQPTADRLYALDSLNKCLWSISR